MDVAVLLIFIVFFVLSLLLFENFRGRARKARPPGPWGFPIVGHLPLFGTYFPETLGKWRLQYGDVFRIRIGSWDSVVLSGYSVIKEALETCGDEFSSRPDFLVSRLAMTNGEESLGFGKFTPAYIRHRKLVTGAFRRITNTKMNDTDELILDEGHNLIEEILSWNNHPEYVNRVVQDTVARIMYRIFYARHANIDKDQFTKFLEIHDEIAKLTVNGSLIDIMPWLRFVMPWKLQKCLNLVNRDKSLVQGIIEEHQSQELDVTKTVVAIFLGMKLPAEVADKHNSMSSSRLMGSLSDLVFAGIETTYGTLQWLILYMIAYPDVQRKVQLEIDDEIGRFRLVQTSDRSKLNYTWATILEVLRHSVNVPFPMPHSTTTNTELNGYSIAKDTLIMINLHSIHMDVAFWKDPKTFRPERLLDKGKKISKEMASHIVSFGFGRRKCVGEHLAKMEIFLLFTTLMQRCSVGKAEGDSLSFEPLGKLSHRPKPFRVVVKDRNESD